MTKYQPNIKDKRVEAKINHAVGFSIALFSSTDDKAMSSVYINKQLGRPNDNLGRWLRRHLLICTDHHYSKTEKSCKRYILNRIGADYVLAFLKGHTTLSYRKWQETIDTDNYIPVFLEDKLVVPSIHKQIYDEQVVSHFFKQEFAEQLESKEFIYNDKSDRLWNPIQNIPRAKKEQLLAEYGLIHTYDIEACAPTLLIQHARHLGFCEYTPCIDAYLSNKDVVRNKIAVDADLSIKQVKVLINALFCGARLGASKHFALFHLIADKTIIDFLKQDTFIISLKKEIKAMWDWIYDLRCTKEYITDKNGHKRRLAMPCRSKWGIYFQLERKALDSINMFIKKTYNQAFLEHDGFSTTNEIDVDACIAYVKNDIGFEIKLSYKNLLANEKAQTLSAFNPVHYDSNNFAGAQSSESCSHSLSLSFFDKNLLFINMMLDFHHGIYGTDNTLVYDKYDEMVKEMFNHHEDYLTDSHCIRKKQLDTS